MRFFYRSFDFAFAICRVGAKAKLPFVHVQYAMRLEEEGQYEEAESHYIDGESPKEAVLMYLHLQRWTKAEQIAK